MDLSTHYESYRKEVQLDAFPDFQVVANATPTADPEKFPSVLDYLKYATGQIKHRIEINDEASYWIALKNHREAIFALFQMMFEREVAAIPKLREPAILDVVQRYGWRKLKFASTILEFDGFTIVPRYTWQFRNVCEIEVCLNADEMAKVMHARPPENLLRQLMAGKEEQQYLISIAQIANVMIPMEERNTKLVYDWSGDLQ